MFSSTGAAAADPNNQRIAPSGTTLNVVSGQTIGPSDVVRADPWGTSASSPDFTINNTDIVSLNQNVMGLLATGDARRNYMLVGVTWIKGGGPTEQRRPSWHTANGQLDDGNFLPTRQLLRLS